MILGYVGRSDGRPKVDAVLEFIDYGNLVIPVTFVIDTGSPRTLLGQEEVVLLEERIGIQANKIGSADILPGIGGVSDTRVVRCNLTMRKADGEAWSRQVYLQLLLPDPESNLPACPSLLGTEVLRFLPKFLDLRRGRVELNDELGLDY